MYTLGRKFILYQHSADVQAGFCSAVTLLIDGTIGYIVTATV
jgi:hypothetical protein